ncbi:hypothetical protein [Streptomyces sp. NPDC002602]|uniref:hypothetical protein n=1 Tax=Streptomyces sp. NPDC002602 TaxID=3364654 RepID=UPI0036AB261B
MTATPKRKYASPPWSRPEPGQEAGQHRRRDGLLELGSFPARTGDFNGDGKTDVGILYGYGRQTGGTNRAGLWRIASTGTGFDVPALAWDSNDR